MALIQCAECKGTVSDQAEACPQCGLPFKTQRVTRDTAGHGVPALFSFFIPGLGQLVKGDFFGALTPWILAYLAIYNISNPLTLLFTLVAIWVLQLVDTYRIKRKTDWAEVGAWFKSPKGMTISIVVFSIVCLTLVIAMLSRSQLASPAKSDSADNIHIRSGVDPLGNARSEEKYAIGGYEILIRPMPEDWISNRFVLEISRNGKELYINKGHMINIVEQDSSVTIDGNPSLVIAENGGGAHSRSTFVFFSLGKVFKVLGKIENHVLKFKDLDADNRVELIGTDNSFDYWESDYAGSPSPTVIFKYSSDGFKLAPELMRKSVLDPASWMSKAEKLRVQMSESQATNPNQDARWAGNGGVPTLLWSGMLDLIYEGNGEMAWNFFHKAWPESKPGKDTFLDSFKKQLSGGEYWPQVKAMNGWKELPSGYPTEQVPQVSNVTPIQIEACQKVLGDAELLMNRVERVRGGIPYNYFIDGSWWRSKTITEKEALIVAISTCKAVIYKEQVIHIYDHSSGEQLGRSGITGPVIYK